MAEITKDWGGWLRAPPRRAAGQEKSNGCVMNVMGSGAKIQERIITMLFSQKISLSVKVRRKIRGKFVRANVHGNVSSVEVIEMIDNSKISAANNIMGNHIGPTTEELTGLSFKERKRRRSGPDGKDYMDTDGGTISVFTEAALSNKDCADSSPTLLAGLAD